MVECLFSVIIPTYNRAELIGKAIESVIIQDYQNWELLIIDDGSTDNTFEIVSAFNDSRIKYHYQINQERSIARNNGVKLSNGKYLCFLDSDDYYLKNHLSNFHSSISIHKFQEAIFYCNTYEDKDGILTKHETKTNLNYKSDLDYVFSNIVGVPRTCIHASILMKYQFDPTIRIGEDLELWMRILKEYPLIYSNAYTVVYKEHEKRTVNENSLTVLKAWLDLIKKISLENNSYLSRDSKKRELSRCYYFIGNYYAEKRKSFFTTFYMVKSILIFPRWKFKEKLFKILDSFIILRKIRLIVKNMNLLNNSH